MKIVLDARWIFDQMSGIGVYTRELVRHLPRLAPDLQYLFLFSSPPLRDRTLAEAGIRDAPNVRTLILNYGLFSLRNQILLPRLLRREQADLYHSTNYMIPFLAFPRSGLARTRCVVTIHDVIPMILREHAPRSRKARLYPLYRRLMIETGIRAHAILADSEVSRRDVLHHLQIPPDRQNKVHTVPCGVSDIFRPADKPAPDPHAPRTVLYVGRADPYKNIETLIRAFAAARAIVPFPLVLSIAGSPDPRYPEPAELAEELGVASAIRWLGYLPEDQLASLYQQADVLAHASRYEGFGLQVAEAMACGLPVVCSNAGSLPEVAGNAAVLLDPDDAGGFANAIADVLTNDAHRRDLVQRGLRQAAQYRWTRTAESVLRIYRDLPAETC